MVRSEALARLLPAPPRSDDWRLVPLGFAALIAVGGMLLTLPWAHRGGGSMATVDALFLSVSAVCVTGLTTVNVGESFNGLGQGILLVLIQLGGLGILTASTLLVLLSGERLSLRDERAIEATMGRLRAARPVDLFIYSCLIVFLTEAAGAVALFSLMTQVAEEGEVPSLWSAVFHAVSAFCNAGISTYPEGLVRWRDRSLMLGVMDLLVIVGGLGLLTLANLLHYRFWRRNPLRRGALSLQTRIALLMTVVLLGAGVVLTLFFERGATLREAEGWRKLSWAFFHSTMARSAGFNVVDNAAMEPATLLGTMFLMFVGGAPGSMAGGIKTVTFFLLVVTAWSALRRRAEINVFRRRIAPGQVHIATMLGLLATLFVFAGIGLLMVTEHQQPASRTAHGWLALMFEAVSAFGTTGLSTGVTSALTAPGKVVVMGLMFVGRVGPLMVALHLSRPLAVWRVRHPEEQLSLG